VQDYLADAKLGALNRDQSNRSRFVTVSVRIGDYKHDSYFHEGTGAVEIIPVENNELALRHQLWLATDKAYKAALTGLSAKRTMLKNVVMEGHSLTTFHASLRSSQSWNCQNSEPR